MKIKIPQLSLVVLLGASGSGKSTFARRHFKPTEILSSDYCRALVGDDELDQTVSAQAFDVMHTIAGKRLELGRLTVIDATNVQKEARRPLVELGRRYHVQPVAIVLNTPAKVCLERHALRTDRPFGAHVIRNQARMLRMAIRGLKLEGFRHIFELHGDEEVEIEREPLWTDKRSEHGPFDIIGDVHGCADELEQLLAKLGYAVVGQAEGPLAGPVYAHPAGRKAVFVGDLVDRGPRVLNSLKIPINMVERGHALCVPGNHDIKLLKKLTGRNVQVTHGLAQTLAEIDAVPEAERPALCDALVKFLDGLISHFVLDDGKLVIAHAGMKQNMQGRASRSVRDYALYGETTGETDDAGLPVRANWAANYRGPALVVYGHTPVVEPEWLNNSVNVDTGCVFGGKLTALRYPERELVSVPAARMYYEPSRPLKPVGEKTAQQENDNLLDAADVLGKRLIETASGMRVMIREENATAALDAMSQFAADPKWLIYLPPTMSPCDTSRLDGLLEHPAEAFDYFRNQKVKSVVCQEKHMGSRAVAVVCKDAATARQRFGTDEAGIVLTRTGRRFFNDLEQETAFLERLRIAAGAAGWWETFETDWFCLDAELMPWSAKAKELLRSQYAAVGAAGMASLPAAATALQAAFDRLPPEARDDAAAVLDRTRGRTANLERYIAAYRGYCWPVESLEDLKLAPFHLLATEGTTHFHRDHVWHMETLRAFCEQDPAILRATPYRVVELDGDRQEAEAIAWWTDLTAKGGEGMVVKPYDFAPVGPKGPVQPAVKCRGREYLRIIYGPDYTLPGNLERLRKRGVGAKRALASREFALGVESLERFVRKEPLRRVHECAFGVLALESEPVDPRL